MRKIIFAILLFLGVSSYTLAVGTGELEYEYWLDITGGVVADLTSTADYIADLPDGTTIVYSMDFPRDWADNYGARATGYIIPPRDGSYTFWISSDDQGQFFLSSDDNPDNLPTEPTCTVLTYVTLSPPSWEEYPEQKSAAFDLEGDKPYYFKAFIKEDGGADSFAIGWGSTGHQVVIPGVAISDIHPYGARNPVPAHRQGSLATEDVLVDANLSWDAPPADPNIQDPLYDVFIGTEPNLLGMLQVADGITETTVAPGTLEYETRYYWRVMTYDNAQTDPNDGEPLLVSSGLYWWFETEQETPVITQQPADQAVFPAEAASFTVVAESTTTIEYAWYDVEDVNEVDVLSTEATLTFDPVAVDDEGNYYCVLTNEAGETVSDTAKLIVKRLKVYWPFEGDATDATGNGYDGTPFGAPTYAAGIIGQAVYLDGVADKISHVLPAEEDWTNGFTVLLWAKATVESQAAYVSVFNNNSSTRDFQVDFNGANYGYRGSSTVVLGPVTTEWIMLAVSCDGSATDLYYNGGFIGTTNVTDTNFGQFEVGVNRGNNLFFNGAIDDVQVYNYDLTSLDIATMYIEEVPDAVICVKESAEELAVDLNNDCKVDLADILIAVENWLACNRVPECL
jgi:hypothetical protein